jgi:aspartyl-tRNA(Asn)/glutamyl-tRNA(Gln) amidotransferase subunit A
MAGTGELLNLDVAELSKALRNRELSPVEVTDAYLERVAEVNPKINAYITITADVARKQAAAAELEIAARRWKGPFHGIPVALKDLCYTAGIRTTGGSKILTSFVPDYDATVWTRLREAGAVLLGKLNLHEFAVGGTSNNPHYGPVRNPYNVERSPGGSSGGSGAAIAARAALATLGTDTRGSIRLPAALCGCVGLKPTYSLVSRYGVIPLSYTLDHVGPITRSVRDAALMLSVIAGPDPNDSTSSHRAVPDYGRALTGEIKGIRVGRVKECAGDLAPEVAASFDRALKTFASLGAKVEEVSLPFVPHGLNLTALIARPELLNYHRQWIVERPGDYGDDVREAIRLGMVIPAFAYVRAQRARARAIEQATSVLGHCDVLAAPTAPFAAPKIGQQQMAGRNGQPMNLLTAVINLTAPFDVTGQPALALPTGLSTEGLPLSMQIIGRPFDEETVLRVADAYERTRGPLPPPAL